MFIKILVNNQKANVQTKVSINPLAKHKMHGFLSLIKVMHDFKTTQVNFKKSWTCNVKPW